MSDKPARTGTLTWAFLAAVISAVSAGCNNPANLSLSNPDTDTQCRIYDAVKPYFQPSLIDPPDRHFSWAAPYGVAPHKTLVILEDADRGPDISQPTRKLPSDWQPARLGETQLLAVIYPPERGESVPVVPNVPTTDAVKAQLWNGYRRKTRIRIVEARTWTQLIDTYVNGSEPTASFGGNGMREGESHWRIYDGDPAVFPKDFLDIIGEQVNK